jgi:predicted RNase H-like nuclease
MTHIAGADGCKSGWIVVYKDIAASRIESRVVAGIQELFDTVDDLAVLAIDIPIGLTESGSRQCDIVARREIGPRSASVFPAPIRAALASETYSEANRISRERQNKGLSKQAFAICPKIRSVDAALRANLELRDRVYEVHPEVSFRAWNGAAMMHPKKSLSGGSDRLRLVTTHFGSDAFDRVRDRHRRAEVGDDDILDAFSALWTAERIIHGTAQILPQEPPFDAAGLPMRIVY